MPSADRQIIPNETANKKKKTLFTTLNVTKICIVTKPHEQNLKKDHSLLRATPWEPEGVEQPRDCHKEAPDTDPKHRCIPGQWPVNTFHSACCHHNGAEGMLHQLHHELATAEESKHSAVLVFQQHQVSNVHPQCLYQLPTWELQASFLKT